MYNLLVLGAILVTLLIWVVIQFSGARDETINHVFALLLGVPPFLASLKGFQVSRAWGGAKSVMGKSVGALAIGLLLWSLGEFVWSYYNLVLRVAAPYPSWADLGYVTGVSFWIISALYLAQLTGVRILLKRKPSLKFTAVAVVVLSIAVSYYLLVAIARQGQILSDGTDLLKTILDIFYPLSDVMSLAIVAVVASVSGAYLGGLLRTPILVVGMGLLASYFFDMTFSYYTTIETYYNGQPTDLLLLVATGLLSFAVLLYGQGVRPTVAAAARTKREDPEN